MGDKTSRDVARRLLVFGASFLDCRLNTSDVIQHESALVAMIAMHLHHLTLRHLMVTES